MAVTASKFNVGEVVDGMGFHGSAEATTGVKELAGSTSDIFARLAGRGIPQSILENLKLLPVTVLLRYDQITDEDLVASGVNHPLHRRRVFIELRHVLAELAELSESSPGPGTCRSASSRGQTSQSRPQSAGLEARRACRPQSAGHGRSMHARPQSARGIGPTGPGRPGSSGAASARPGSSGRARQSAPSSEAPVKPPVGETCAETPAEMAAPASVARGTGDSKWRWPYVQPNAIKKGAGAKKLVPEPPPRPRSAGRVYGQHRKTARNPRRSAFLPMKLLDPSKEAMDFVAGQPPSTTPVVDSSATSNLPADTPGERRMSEQGINGEGAVPVDGPGQCKSSAHEQQEESEAETPYVDWESWLEYRLMPGGPLAIIEGLQRAAAGGNPELLRTVIHKAEVHGPEFLLLLDAMQPVPSRLNNNDSNDKDTQNVHGLWTWARSRLDKLGHAESELETVVDVGLRAVQNARRIAPPRQEDACKPLNTDATSNRPSCQAASATPNGRKSRARLSGGVLRSALRFARQRTFDNDKAVSTASFLSAQRRLLEAAQRLRFVMRVVDQSVGLEGRVRNQAGVLLTQLQQCQEDVFDRFVQFRQPVAFELQSAVALQSCDTTRLVRRLRTAISAARHEAGAKTLIGEAAIAWGESHGIGIYHSFCEHTEEAAEPPSPWADTVVRRIPPWEAAYLAAVQRLLEALEQLSYEGGEEEADLEEHRREEDNAPDAETDSQVSSFQKQRTAFDAHEFSSARQLEAASYLEAPADREPTRQGAAPRRGAVVKRASLHDTITENAVPRNRSMSFLSEVHARLPEVEAAQPSALKKKKLVSSLSKVNFSLVEFPDSGLEEMIAPLYEEEEESKLKEDQEDSLVSMRDPLKEEEEGRPKPRMSESGLLNSGVPSEDVFEEANLQD